MNMEMTASLLWLCLALAVIGLLVLVFALRRLVAAANNRSASSNWLLAAGGVLAAGLCVIDSVILWCLIEYSLLGIDFSSEGLRALMAQAGFWAPLASIALMVAHSFVPFPAEVIAIANGVAFGPWLGVAITWIGAMLGAIASYELARGLGPAARRRLIPTRYRARLDTFALNIGIAPLLVARFLPIVSFNLINYAAGLAGVPRLLFIGTTGLGILPLTVLSVLVGSQALELPLYIWIVGSVVLLLLLLLLVAVRFARRAIKRHDPKRQTGTSARYDARSDAPQ
ncbi:hypothetical protein SADO_16763 [Salinisphaera dokdonensis CL-ES53]|uniref:TVP38/TMEM64 family membrane protein n=2 Tax=Salinisphaera TaxID=180541 RepID=A0ABV2B4V7_9GAMM